MTQKLSGKVAVVTGASKGIGASIALHLADEGAAVVVNYSSDKEGAQKVVTEITKQGGKAIAIHANMTNQKDIEKLFTEASKEFGKIDILVNNAGIYEFVPIEEVTVEHYHKIFDINVLGLLLATKEALKYFNQSGSIVNISSIVSLSPVAGGGVYSASKAAVDSITKTMAIELAPRKIRVNAINPGMIQTEGTKTGGILESEFRKQVESQTPLGRIGLPSDITPAVIYLASDDSSWITGQTLFITGGYR